MAENLKFKVKEGAFYFDNDSNNIPGYGVLYEWKTAISACPTRWHLPSGAEFQILANHFEHKETWEKIPSEPSSFGIQLGVCRITRSSFLKWTKAAITGHQQNMIRVTQNISAIY